jgi:hypothetical protein
MGLPVWEPDPAKCLPPLVRLSAFMEIFDALRRILLIEFQQAGRKATTTSREPAREEEEKGFACSNSDDVQLSQRKRMNRPVASERMKTELGCCVDSRSFAKGDSLRVIADAIAVSGLRAHFHPSFHLVDPLV